MGEFKRVPNMTAVDERVFYSNLRKPVTILNSVKTDYVVRRVLNSHVLDVQDFEDRFSLSSSSTCLNPNSY